MQTKLVNTKDIKPSTIRHEELPLGFIKRVLEFKEILKEVETSSVERTVSNFQRDLYPENELIIWEYIANAYQTVTKEESNLTLTMKKKVFAKILKSTMSSVPDINVGV